MGMQKELSRTEKGILAVIKHLERRGETQIHGFLISKELQDISGIMRKKSRFMIGYGTLYNALDNLRKAGLLSAEWEELPEGEQRPRRRYYRVVKE